MNFEIPYSRQNINEEDIDSVVKVLRSDYITQGPILEEFQNSLKKYLGSSHAIACNSATSCLHLACLALDLGINDILWTSPISFVASANCARYCGANVDFVDIDKDTGLICLSKLKEKLEYAFRVNRLPKILVPVHLGGSSCDMEEIWKLSKKYNFKVIEDASHALGGKYKNKYVGSCEFSDICVFSFHPVKIITTGEGGIALTNNEEYADKIIKLRSHGITRNREEYINVDKGPWYYEQQNLGFNYRMSDIQASLGISQLKRLSTIVEKRNNILKKYKQELKDLPLSFLNIPPNVYSSVHLGIIKINQKYKNKYSYIFKKLHQKGIKVQLHYLPIHLQPYYRKLGFKENDFINAEEYAKSALSLPIFPELSNENIKYIVACIFKIFEDIN